MLECAFIGRSLQSSLESSFWVQEPNALAIKVFYHSMYEFDMQLSKVGPNKCIGRDELVLVTGVGTGDGIGSLMV